MTVRLDLDRDFLVREPLRDLGAAVEVLSSEDRHWLAAEIVLIQQRAAQFAGALTMAPGRK